MYSWSTSSFDVNLGFKAAICIATFLSASLISSLITSVSASTKTPILPPPWIYGTTIPSALILTNLLIAIFSPITAIFENNSSFTVFAVSFTNGASANSSTVAYSFDKICFATASTNVVNFSFFATKSVSELTSTIAAFLSSSTTASTTPSAAILPAFLTAVASPFSLNNSIALSKSPSVSTNAFLQAITPAPVISLSSFTIDAVISINISSVIFD